MDYKQAVNYIANARKKLEMEIEAEKERLLNIDKNYLQIETALRASQLDIIQNKAVELNYVKELQQKKTKYEKEHNLMPPPYSCDKCRDTGIYKAKPCDCAIKYAINNGLKQAVELKLVSKEHLDFSNFTPESLPRIKKTYQDTEKIINSFPNSRVKMVLLLGGTGTGKTFLASYAANIALQRGLSVIAASAFSINQRVSKYHTTFDNTRDGYLTPLIDSDVLIIDDLGTESILKNVTIEYLYQIINERNTLGKLTIITSNLPPQGILSRYGERIYSRIFDKSLCYASIFNGKDLRKIFEL